VERAAVPQTPFRPDRIKISILALAGSLAAGLGILFLRNRTDSTIKDRDDVEDYLRTDCLAVVPRHGDTFNGVATEAYQSLRFNLLLSRERERGNVVLVTSSVPEEGKSTTALNMARALAGAGESTLLLDFDLRRNNIHKRLQLNVRPGLSDYFLRDFPLLQSIVQKTRFSNLYAIVPGRLPSNPPSFIGSPAVKRLLEEARERYTWILLNAPPILGPTHPLFMCELSDMMLMVVRSNMVDRKLVRRCLSILTNTDARLIGAILTGVEPGQDRYHGRHHTNGPIQPTQQATVTPIRRAAWRAR
jgi:receptor protein-tyrosine kinase